METQDDPNSPKGMLVSAVLAVWGCDGAWLADGGLAAMCAIASIASVIMLYRAKTKS